MKTLGLDLGSQTLGIAISDVFGKVANPRETFTFKSAHYKHAVAHVAEMVQKEKITTVVLGLPKNMNNTEGERGEISRRFAKKIEVATGIHVILWDERMTTIQVERLLIACGVRRNNRKKYVDKLAATIILQSYLDSKV